jgi:hypothetical protein
MFDLTIVIDEQMPPHALYATVSDGEVRVTVSPRVESAVLGVLESEIALAVAGGIDVDEAGGKGGES